MVDVILEFITKFKDDPFFLIYAMCPAKVRILTCFFCLSS